MYLPTLLHEQDMTQGQIFYVELNRVEVSFPSPRLIA